MKLEVEKILFRRISGDDFVQLSKLQKAYKSVILEEPPTEEGLAALKDALEKEKILFFGCEYEGNLVAMCSVCKTFSTFDYGTGGVFEDFYIKEDYRHVGIAKKLVEYAYRESGVSSMTVGCADCDVEMYKAVGFTIPLGNMLAFG